MQISLIWIGYLVDLLEAGTTAEQQLQSRTSQLEGASQPLDSKLGYLEIDQCLRDQGLNRG